MDCPQAEDHSQPHSSVIGLFVHLLDMAQAWLVLAEHANKNMGAPASIYETPEQQHAIQQQQQPQTDE
jgi:hypothetical protein